MKKNPALVALTLLVVATLCIAQTGATSKSKSKNAGGKSLAQMIIDKSRATWKAYKSRNIAAIKVLTAGDASYGLRGPSNLEEDIANLNNNKLTIESYTIDDPKISRVTKDVAILRYKCELKGSLMENRLCQSMLPKCG